MPLVLIAMFASYWFITTGIVWAVLSVVVSLSIAVVLLMPVSPIDIPTDGSQEFNESVARRKKQSLLGGVLLIAWVISWLIT